jgi:hypothetical protein
MAISWGTVSTVSTVLTHQSSQIMFEYGHHGAGGRDTEYEGVDECDECNR